VKFELKLKYGTATAQLTSYTPPTEAILAARKTVPLRL
jgi:hypothetical protein